METQNVFVYRYSASQNKEVERIRQRYLPQEESKIERLRKLDRRVQSAGVVPALCLGVIGCLVFGVGLCIGLEVLVGAKWLAALLGVIGVLLMTPAYAVHRSLAAKARAELTPEILCLSEEIIRSAKK